MSSTPPGPPTADPRLSRLLIRAALAAGLERAELTRIPGITGIREDGVRIADGLAAQIWEAIAEPVWAAGGAGRIMELWRPGTLGVWDYLFRAARDFGEGLRAAGEHIDVIASDKDGLRVTRDDDGAVSVRYLTGSPDWPTLPFVAEFVPVLFMGPGSAGAGRAVTPVRIRFPHRAPAHHRDMYRLYGTRDIEFETGSTVVTFAAADAETPMPGADPALAAILGDHARLTVATARPLLGWLDEFRRVLESVWAAETPEMEQVARRLTLGPRTLQRRLREEGTNWREELDRVRRRRVDALLHDTSMTLETIAARTGYTDVRALRRAIHRWHGQGATAVRRARHR